MGRNLTSIMLLIISLLFILKSTNTANILAILPLPIKSHFVMGKTILEGLASKGHNVDLFTRFSEENPIPRLNYNLVPGKHFDTDFSVEDLRKITVTQMMSIMFEQDDNGNDLCEKFFASEVARKLRDSKKHYDLMLVEMFVSDCFFALAHAFGIPVVAITSSVDLPWGSYRMGNVDNPSYIPTYFGEFGNEMTLSQRIINTLTLLYAKYKQQTNLKIQEKIVKEFFGNECPPLDEIVSNTSLILVNSHFSLQQSRPKVRNFIEIAGLHIREPKALPKMLADDLGESKFIYFSFGSIAHSETLPLETLKNLCQAFEELKYKVLWKADKEKFPKGLEIPKNVITHSWMPQLDILCHPNILVFITHGGLMSTQEAVHCGVPMLTVPMFADQFLNSQNNVAKNIGLELKIENASKEDILRPLKELIHNPKYQRSVKELSAKFRDRQNKPLDEAIYWIEYVIRHKGAPELRCKSADLPWYKLYLVDVGLIIFGVLLVLLIVLLRIVLFIKNILFCNNKKEKIH